MDNPLKPGDRIETTGRGVTANWPRMYRGTVTRATRRAVFVRWDGCTFEDERAPEEVRRAGDSDKSGTSDVSGLRGGS